MPETLGQLIQRRMKDVGIPNKAELARRLGVSSAYAGDLANDTGKTKDGSYKPEPDLVQKLSEVLQVSEVEILSTSTIGYIKNPIALPPRPIIEAIGQSGFLTEEDHALAADFIRMLNDKRKPLEKK